MPIRLSNASKWLSDTTAGQGIKEVRIINQGTCAVLHRAIASKELQVVSQESALGIDLRLGNLAMCVNSTEGGHLFWTENLIINGHLAQCNRSWILKNGANHDEP